jgi:hypothetical protein
MTRKALSLRNSKAGELLGFTPEKTTYYLENAEDFQRRCYALRPKKRAKNLPAKNV